MKKYYCDKPGCSARVEPKNELGKMSSFTVGQWGATFINPIDLCEAHTEEFNGWWEGRLDTTPVANVNV